MTRAAPRLLCLLALLGLIAALTPTLPASAASTAITSSGPLTKIATSETLNCAVNHVDDSQHEFYSDTACGTLVAVGGTLYGPADIPAGRSAEPRTTYTPVSQSAVTGSGTTADPYAITTVVALGDTGLRLTQTDSYVVGQESYRTDVTVTDTDGSGATGIVYRAGDCYLQDDDDGYGVVDADTGAVACVAPDRDDDSQPGDRIEQWLPLTAGSHYLQADYNEVWSKIGAQEQFNDTCRCDESIDNGAGLSWPLSLVGGASATFAHLTTFSPQGHLPLTVRAEADTASVEAGGTLGYEITISNPNDETVDVETITATLPPGFTYQAGSSTGVTTDDATVHEQVLTWVAESGYRLPGGGSISVAFDVTVGDQAGTYRIEAGGFAPEYTVSGTGSVAPVEVVGGERELPARLQDLWIVDSLSTVNDGGEDVDLTGAILDELATRGGETLELPEGATFTTKSVLEARITDASGQLRDDVDAVGGVLITTDGEPHLAILGTPDAGEHIGIDDQFRFEVTFLEGEGLLEVGDPVFADYWFSQVLPSDEVDNALPPVELFAERMAAGSGRYYAIEGDEGAEVPGLLVDRVWFTFEGSIGVGGSAKDDALMDGLTGGAQDAVDEGGGVGGVDALLDSILDGFTESECMVSSQITVGGGGGSCGNPGPPPGAPGGSATGDPHLDSIDGLDYDLQAVGEFVFASTDGLEVQARFAPFGSSRTIAVTTAVAIGFDGHSITVDSRWDEPVKVDGETVPLEELAAAARNISGAELSLDPISQDELTLTTVDGHIVFIDQLDEEQLNLYVYPAQGHGGAFQGLIGDGDGDVGNDLVGRDGSTAYGTDPSFEQLYDGFADSWRISQAESLFAYGPGETTQTFTDLTFPDRPVTVETLPADERERAEAVCRAAGIEGLQALNDCILDYAVTGEVSFLRASQDAGVVEGVEQGTVAPITGSTACPVARVPEAAFTDLNPAATHTANIACVAWWDLTQGTSPTTYSPVGSVSRAQMATFVARLLTSAGVTPPENAADAFSDDNADVHEANINALAALGVVNGVGDDRYGPAVSLSRAQMAAFLVRSLEQAGLTLGDAPDAFADDNASVHEADINAAAAAGLTNGRTATQFDPHGLVTRAQMATFLVHALDLLVEGGEVSLP